MCKEMPVIPVNKVVDPKRIIRKKEGQRGGEAQGVADPKKERKKHVCMKCSQEYIEPEYCGFTDTPEREPSFLYLPTCE
jgi:hypothetical protein